MQDYPIPGFEISSERQRLNYRLVHEFLTRSYWASGISFEKVKRSLDNSFCFGVYQERQQVGFARVITDFSRIAYLADVFIVEEFRGQGLSTWLVKTILDHPDLRGIVKWFLITKDAHDLYSRFGFEAPKAPEMYMEMVRK